MLRIIDSSYSKLEEIVRNGPGTAKPAERPSLKPKMDSRISEKERIIRTRNDTTWPREYQGQKSASALTNEEKSAREI